MSKHLTDEEFALKILEAQKKDPLLSEKGVLGALGFGVNQITIRSKKSSLIQEAREHMSAIREKAWIEKGILGLASKEFNSTLYIWMTRNILGWRDKTQEEAQDEAPVQVSVTPESIRHMLSLARGEVKA